MTSDKIKVLVVNSTDGRITDDGHEKKKRAVMTLVPGSIIRISDDDDRETARIEILEIVRDDS